MSGMKWFLEVKRGCPEYPGLPEEKPRTIENLKIKPGKLMEIRGGGKGYTASRVGKGRPGLSDNNESRKGLKLNGKE